MRILFIAIIVLSLYSCKPSAAPEQPQTVSEVMDDVITRLYKEVPATRYDSIDDAFMLGFLTNEEKQVLAKRYLYFSVNVPVTVSLMRHTSQDTPPFWLDESGFVKTDLTVKNVEGYEYEVWEKKFEAGTVELGINGFDKHRPVYFISVGKVNPSDDLKITDVYPSQYSLDTMRVGAFTYHDWTSLTLAEVPEKLLGQVLFTTVRGRAREAHVVKG